MKVTVCFDNIRVVVPCGDGSLLVRDLMREAIIRYRKATGKTEPGPVINSLSSLTGGGLLDPDDRLCDVADDREQIIAHINNSEVIHIGGDGASSVGTNSPDYFQPDDKDNRYGIDTQTKINNNIKRESVKRLSMHALSTRELVGPSLPTYSALSLPRESRRREPLGQDAKATYELTSKHPDLCDQNDIQHIIIKNEPGPLGLHVVPCYDLLGNDQGLRVEGIEPNGRIAKDGQIDLHDKIIRINSHNLLKIPFTKVQEIFRTCMNEPCLKISVIKHKKLPKKSAKTSNDKLDQPEDNLKKLQCANYNLLQNANTRKIGRMIEIELTKGTNGLGFSVTTRDNPAGGHCPIYIKNILPKGAAVEDGRLKSGDRLLEVNKIEMTGKSQAEVVSLLRSIPPGGKVRMTVSRQEEVSTSSLETPSIPVTSTNTSHVSETNSWSSPSVSPVKASDEFDNGKNYDKNYKQLGDDVMLSPRKNRIILTFDIPVHDSEKAGLGVSVKGKTTSADENTNMDLGIFIKSVIHGGAASRDGRLKTNDQLLNVNGVSLLGLSNSDAMETLRRAMLNTNSVVSGVITLTIARRVSSYDSDKNNRNDGIASCKLESANSIFISDNKSDCSGVSRVMEKNNLNNQESLDDSLLSSTSVSPWNPVIERLTEQYNKNSIRNESYCLATNKTWIDSVSNAKKIMNRDNDLVLLEESIPDNVHDVKKNVDDKESQYSGDPSYDSQLSLEEFTSGNQFSRDALGRQSMSEKRHAALDAKNTDTYKRNKKLREGRENKCHGNKIETEESKSNVSKDDEQVSKKSGESQFEVTRRRFEKKSESGHSDYVYTIPGCNNKISPKKHWLVDDNPVDVGNNNQCKDEPEGFSHSRGDVKQASLNSALDKRSRKKGLKSMLRLGKNRKSLNFGDNLDARHESILQSVQWNLLVIPKRFKSKPNITKPRKPHYTRAVFGKFVGAYYKPKVEPRPIWEACSNIQEKMSVKTKEHHPYHDILAREAFNWFKSSRMIAFVHKNSINALDLFDAQVPLFRANMHVKYYELDIMERALENTPYEPVLKLCNAPWMVIFGPDGGDVKVLTKVLKSTPQLILIAGIYDGVLLNVKDFVKYGRMSIDEARASLVQTLQSGGGTNLNRMLNYHSSTLVSRLEALNKKQGGE